MISETNSTDLNYSDVWVIEKDDMPRVISYEEITTDIVLKFAFYLQGTGLNVNENHVKNFIETLKNKH